MSRSIAERRGLTSWRHGLVARAIVPLVVGLAAAAWPGMVGAAPFFFSTGNPDGLIGTAARPDVGVFEIESADDFVLTSRTRIDHITFVGLLVGGTVSNLSLSDTVLEMYRVFPNDSDVGRTSGLPPSARLRCPPG